MLEVRNACSLPAPVCDSVCDHATAYNHDCPWPIGRCYTNLWAVELALLVVAECDERCQVCERVAEVDVDVCCAVEDDRPAVENRRLILVDRVLGVILNPEPRVELLHLLVPFAVDAEAQVLHPLRQLCKVLEEIERSVEPWSALDHIFRCRRWFVLCVCEHLLSVFGQHGPSSKCPSTQRG